MKRMKTLLSAVLLASATATFAAEPSGYYDACEGLGGKSLLSKLCSVVGNHTNVGYNGLWSLYESTDVDANGKIWDIYSTKRWVYNREQCGSYSDVGDCYNREHSFPKSWFNDASPMYSDAFHIYPTDGKVNAQRSNHPYGECANGTTLSSKNGVNALGKLGKSTYPGYSGTVFEPDDQYKGDLARSYFYMAAAYNDRIAGWDSEMLNGTTYPAFASWAMEMLLKWHRQDPVSQKEIDRNEAVYKKQHNRNPFIDHPEMAEYIWGNKSTSTWSATSAVEATIIKPVDGSTISFGTTAVNYTISRSISVKTEGLTKPLSISINNNSVKANTATITAASANAGTSFAVTWRPTSAGKLTAALTISSGEVSAIVNLVGEAVTGIPALEAANITETSFTARWMDLGDEEPMKLHVMKAGANISGYPVSVNPAAEEYDVKGLEVGTTYTYQLKTSSKESNIVSVTTAAPIPSIEYLVNTEVELTAEPFEPSQAVEMWIDTENIDVPITATVAAPFELSTDMSGWGGSITLQPAEDRFYVRLGATGAGNYFSSIDLRAGSYVNDEATVTAIVVDSSEPWFIEDFEDADNSRYNQYDNYTYKGKIADWLLVNCGIFVENSNRRNGDYSVRMGNSLSSIATASPKNGGIGTVSFYASRWSESDGNVAIDVQYSTDGDEWTTAGSVVVDNNDLTRYEVNVGVSGTYYLRLQQTEGKRGNIDDIVVSDRRTNSVDTISDRDGWDAFCRDGRLVIVNKGEARPFAVFGVNGIMHVDSRLAHGESTFDLTPGVYIVTDDTVSRTVMVGAK